MKSTLLLVLIVLLASDSNAREDHSEFIEGPFDSPQEVTDTCLGCHEEAGEQVMKTRHWNWLGSEFSSGERGVIRLGKQNLINNFCIAVTSNWPRCTSCHIGYGWKDESFDHSDPGNIDCLICHDQTGTYRKTPTGAGMPDPSVDLEAVAKSVGPSTRRNCGVCHFDGGGGSGVKHGDLDESMFNPARDLDVHMGGNDCECTACHQTEEHQILGAGHGSMAQDINHVACTDCHENDVHGKSVLTKHVNAVACETCHIPTFAREQPTKIWWDWSTAGQDRKSRKDEYGKETYSKKKGDFVWAKNVVPVYRWYKGEAEYYVQGDTFDPSTPVMINSIKGDIQDPSARIAPFKLMRGKQPYDSEHDYLIVPHLFGPEGFWKTFDWNSASEIGMKAAGLPYSGSYGFVETEMYWPINHMVMSADNALKCTNCHGKKGDHLLDWKKLGYPDDPMKKGGREKNGLIKD